MFYWIELAVYGNYDIYDARLGALQQKFGVQWDRGVWRVHKPWHLEWNTPGSPRRYAGIFGGLLSKHLRYQAFTVFEAESTGIRSQAELKTEKSRMDRAEDLSANKEKDSLFHYYLGWLIRWKVCITHERCRRNHNCRTKFQTKRYLSNISSCLNEHCTMRQPQQPPNMGSKIRLKFSFCAEEIFFYSFHNLLNSLPIGRREENIRPSLFLKCQR